VIFPAYPTSEPERRKEVEAIREALQPLLRLRERDTRGRFSAWVQGTDKGFRVGADTRNSYLARHGAGPGPANPDKVPYYLLIVGGPSDIPYRWYWGSNNDLLLNLRTARFRASPLALAAIRANYETSGKPRIPIVMPHTTQDEVVRFEQSLRYRLKARPEGTGRVTVIPITRFGHCNFTPAEIVLSFALLVRQATGALPATLATEVAELDAAPLDTDLTPYLEALRAAEAEDAAHQAEASWNRVYLPVVVC
jgi:hypothetical protein